MCTLEGFDFSINPQIERNYILELAQLRWIRNKSNILFLGLPGVERLILRLSQDDKRFNKDILFVLQILLALKGS